MDGPITSAIVDATRPDRGGDGQGLGASYLTSIANAPVIAHVLRELARGGIRQAAVLTHGELRPVVERAVGDVNEIGMNVRCVDYDGPATRWTLLSGWRPKEPVLLHPGDCLFPDKVPVVQSRFSVGDADVVVLGERLLALGEAARLALRSFDHEQTNHLLGSLSAARCRVAVCDAGEFWHYGDSTDQLLAANRMLLDALEPLTPSGCVDDATRIEGRVTISPSASIFGSTIRGPCLIGDRALVEESFIGPYTAVGADTVLAGAEIDYCMVLAGAKLRYPGYRIQASVIGERATVARSFELPKAVHLELGADARVIFG